MRRVLIVLFVVENILSMSEDTNLPTDDKTVKFGEYTFCVNVKVKPVSKGSKPSIWSETEDKTWTFTNEKIFAAYLRVINIRKKFLMIFQDYHTAVELIMEKLRKDDSKTKETEPQIDQEACLSLLSEINGSFSDLDSPKPPRQQEILLLYLKCLAEALNCYVPDDQQHTTTRLFTNERNIKRLYQLLVRNSKLEYPHINLLKPSLVSSFKVSFGELVFCYAFQEMVKMGIVEMVSVLETHSPLNMALGVLDCIPYEYWTMFPINKLISVVCETYEAHTFVFDHEKGDQVAVHITFHSHKKEARCCPRDDAVPRNLLPLRERSREGCKVF